MSTPSSTSADAASHDAYMKRALDLAQGGLALAHPNPIVGAVLVKNGRVVGEGFHIYDRRDHAEIVALKKAGKEARGATLYVTLEPCCTTGRTGPCTKAIIAAGIKNVYAPTKDPNPKVAGRGFAALKRAGIKVHFVESFTQRARAANEGFAKWIRTGLPFVTLKTALTLDGQIASRAGTTTWLTSAASLEEVQRLRHQADALLTGIGTVLADDPRMSDRTGLPRRRRLLRAVVDSRLRMPLKSKLVKSAQGDLIIFTTQGASARSRRGRSRSRPLARRPCGLARRPPRTRPPRHSECFARSRFRAKWRRAPSPYCGQNDSLLCSQNHGDGRRADGSRPRAMVCRVARAEKYIAEVLRGRFRRPRIFSRCLPE